MAFVAIDLRACTILYVLQTMGGSLAQELTNNHASSQAPIKYPSVYPNASAVHNAKPILSFPLPVCPANPLRLRVSLSGYSNLQTLQSWSKEISLEDKRPIQPNHLTNLTT